MGAISTVDTMSARAKARRTGKGRTLYASNKLVASAIKNGRVEVDVSIGTEPKDLAVLETALVAVAPETRAKVTAKATGAAAKVLAAAFEKVASRYLVDAFSGEFDQLVAEYRVMLRENFAKGDDAALAAALNRARLQERILASTQMADQADACVLLGLSNANPSATMKRKAGKHALMRFTVDGRAVYPLFQFDVEGRRIYPAMSQIIAATPDNWSDFRLLHWLTRPHIEFDDTPGAALGSEPEAVVAAFKREIEPPVHG